MADIGIRVDADSLVLWRGRDFKWTFENLDLNGDPAPYPAGSLFFELQTGGEHNALHRVNITGATGGSYKLNVNGVDTPNIDFNDVSENPQGLPGDITDALETALGAGNVEVHPVSLFPAWTLNFNLNASKPLSEQLVNTINKAANDFFDTFDQLLGVDVEMTVTDALNFKLKVTSRRSFDEVGVVTFAVDVTSTAVKNFFNGFAGLVGAVNTVSTDFYWNRQYNIEFTGSLALQPIPPTTADITNLVGTSKAITVTVEEPGKHPLTIWEFDIDGSVADIKIESEKADEIAPRTKWQLVFLADGEPAGGDPIALGTVTRLG
uniref:LtfC/p132/Gp6 beta-sandwich domain-containing protein n=1 Tax=Mycobacterium phage BabyBack TaxID=3158877 RepID=A0AAU8GQK9_9CAUD